MYIKGKKKDLTPINGFNNELFITSGLDELDYFHCNKENLVALRDYLLELKEEKKEYDKLIAKPLKSIQEKNPWCLDIQPVNNDIYTMEAKAKNYPSISIGWDHDKIHTSGIAYSSTDIFGWVYSKRLYNRIKIINNSKEELEEIRNIIKSLNLLTQEEGFISASNHFLIIPNGFEEIQIKKIKEVEDYCEVKINKNGKITSNYHEPTISYNNYENEYKDEYVKKLYLQKK